MDHVFHRNLHTRLPVAVAGEGVYLVDSEGKRYLDGSGGPAVSCLGHSHPRVIEAIRQQASRLPFAHTAFFTTAPMEELADILAASAPGELKRVYFVSGGSEGIEAAIKMARQYFVEVGQPERHHVISRRQGYHGNTLGALAVSGNKKRRIKFEPMLVATTRISPCYPYRHQRADESLEAYGRRAADELEEAIQFLGPGTVAAFVAETVVGATLGAAPAAPGYFQRIREICDKHGVLLILDEVMCGMGRTGTLHACEQDGVTPDLLVMAKGLGAGYQPIGAVLVAQAVYEAFEGGTGFFQHGHTYMGHAIACAAAVAVQKVIREEDLLAKVRARGARLKTLLRERLGGHSHIGEIRGRGLFVGLELVADRATKAPFASQLQLHARVKKHAFRRGLICYPAGGTIDGWNGDHVLLAPPFIVEDDDLAMIVERLSAALEDSFAEAAMEAKSSTQMENGVARTL